MLARARLEHNEKDGERLDRYSGKSEESPRRQVIPTQPSVKGKRFACPGDGPWQQLLILGGVDLERWFDVHVVFFPKRCPTIGGAVDVRLVVQWNARGVGGGDEKALVLDIQLLVGILLVIGRRLRHVIVQRNAAHGRWGPLGDATNPSVRYLRGCGAAGGAIFCFGSNCYSPC